MTTPTISKATVAQLNAIVNRPDVITKLGGRLYETRDIREIEYWKQTTALTCGDGCMLFVKTEASGIYRTDLLFIPGHRNNMRDARAMMTHVFKDWGAVGIFGFTPRSNSVACRFVEKLPGVLVGQTENDENIYAARRADWPWLTNGA